MSTIGSRSIQPPVDTPARALSLAAITQIARDYAGDLGPLVQVALSSSLGQATIKSDQIAASQRLFAAAPAIVASVIKAGTARNGPTTDLTLGMKVELLGRIFRLTVEAHSLVAIATAFMMPSLAAGIIGTPSISRPAEVAIN